MYKKTLTYQTYDDEPETIVEDFYFNINEAEAFELELDTPGGIEKYFNNILIKRDVPKMKQFFKTFILKALGQKSPDGKRFVKNQEIRDDFEQSDAYNVLMMELFTKENAATEFLMNILPTPDGKKGKMSVTDMNKILKERVADDPALANALGLDNKQEKTQLTEVKEDE